MIRKPSRFALVAISLACAALLAACGDSTPVLRYISISPTSGTVYVSATPDSGVKAARRPARPMVRTSRRASATPRDITTAVCGSQQFSATGYYSNGTTSDQSMAVTWSSSSSSVATVDNTGLATGVGLGFANIGATLANVSAQSPAQLEVDVLNTITVAPPNPDIALGQAQAFTATGNFTLAAGGTASQDITAQVTWASSNTGVATVDNMGNITTVTQGTTIISATSCDGITMGQTNLTIGPPVAVSLQITPAAATASTGTTVQYTAVRLLTDGSTQPTANPVTWSSDTTSVATINASTALAQALTAGTANITATEAVTAYTGTVPLTVQAAAARFAYVANIAGSGGSGSITSYTVDTTSTSAPLTFLATTAASSPEQVLLHPSGDLLYYIDTGGALHSDCVDSTSGALTPTTQNPKNASTAGGNTYVGVIDPTGRFIYVITAEENVIFGFSITQAQPATCSSATANAGALTAIPGMAGTTGYTDATLNAPTWIVTDATGQFLYIVNSGANTVSEYKITQSSGVLTPLGTKTIATGTSPLFAATDVNGHLFVANEGTNPGTPGNAQSVSAYTITASGSTAGELTAIGSGPTPITGAFDTINVAVNPNGNFLYVLDSGSGATITTAGQVFSYGLTASSGVIGAVIGTPQTTGVGPTGMSIDPTGVLLAIDNFSDGDVSTYSIGTNGGVTPTTTATVPSDSSTEFVVFYNAASGQ
jgi:6-phosphogluconolactonase (cycloisomerase 2 family)